MARYDIQVSATAEKQLCAFQRSDQVRIAHAIQSPAFQPFPRGTRKLRGYEDVFRVRVGVYRILYSVESDRLLIIILKVGQRKDIYRRWRSWLRFYLLRRLGCRPCFVGVSCADELRSAGRRLGRMDSGAECFHTRTSTWPQ